MRGEHFGHVERIAAGGREQLPCVGRARRLAREFANACLRQGLERHANRAAAWQFSHHRQQAMPRVELVVAVGEYHERRDVRDAASHELDQIERRVVRPVHVLDDDDDGSLLQFTQNRAEYRAEPSAASQRVCV